MSPIVTSLGGWWLHGVAGGGFVLLAGWLLARRTWQPARRQRLAEWAVGAALVLLVLCLGPTWLCLPWTLPAGEAPPAQERPASTASARPEAMAEDWVPADEPPRFVNPGGEPAPLTAEDLDEADTDDFLAGAVAAPAAGPPEEKPAEAGDVVAVAPALRSWPARALGVVFAAYAAGVAFLLGRWLLGHVALWRLARDGVRPARPVVRLFEGMAAGLRRKPRLLVSPRVRVPLSWGVLRPTVVLPRCLGEAPPGPELRWVFAHELTHLERRDVLGSLLLGLGGAAFFVWPWFWWLARQARLCREFVADAAAVRAGGAPEDYAQFLLRWTAAPAVPAAAAGVTGHSSDLFRRVTMLLQNPDAVENRCPRTWTLAAAGGLLALAVCAAGVGLKADAAPAPADQPRVVVGQEEDDPAPQKRRSEAEVDELKKLEAVRDEARRALARYARFGDSPEEVRKALDDVQRTLNELRSRLQEIDGHGRGVYRRGLTAVQAYPQPGQQPASPYVIGRPDPAALNAFTAVWQFGGGGRLGISVAPPDAALADQLGLEKDRGLVITGVQPDSAAARAGLKAHDILLELDGREVSSDPARLVKMLDTVKAGAKLDAEVLRKGKRVTVHDIEPGEAKSGEVSLWDPASGKLKARFRNGVDPNMVPAQPGVGYGAGAGAGRGVMTSVFRTDDRVTTRHQEGSLVITLTGKVADGKARIREIHVQDGGADHDYQSLSEVPERYRDKVKNLIQLTERGGSRIDVELGR